MGAEHPALWSTDHEKGNEKAYCCFNSNTRDFARIGKLMLDSGKWNGNLLSTAVITSTPSNPVASQMKKGLAAIIMATNGGSIRCTRRSFMHAAFLANTLS
jgi:hypothetical protein